MSKEFAAFLVHQVIGTLGVVMASAMSWYTFLELLKLGRIGLTTETAMFPLLGIPGFPFQGASGFVLGFTLARRLRARSVVFVWILPLLWFGLGALVVAPTSELGYLIGGSCNADRGCFYQLSFTLPLIASIAYTSGAIVSGWWQRRSKSAQKVAMPDSGTQSEYWDPHHNDLSGGGVTVATFQTEEECNFASYLLSEEGVRSAVVVPERRLDLRLPQVRVAPDDEALARRILAQPITAKKRAQYEAEPECAQFVTPCCPVCASSEVVLESVANGNSWRCDICGKRWSEVPEVTDG